MAEVPLSPAKDTATSPARASPSKGAAFSPANGAAFSPAKGAAASPAKGAAFSPAKGAAASPVLIRCVDWAPDSEDESERVTIDREEWRIRRGIRIPCSRCGLIHSEYMRSSWIYGFEEFDCKVVQRFRALPEGTVNEHSRLVVIYEDLNALEHILEGRQKPNNLSYSLLQFMTKNFSVERKMGNNEFGEFFKGILQVVAIIRLSGSLEINDRIFHGEMKITMMAQHQNIVRFLGNCSYAAKEEASIHGKTTNAEIREWLLCFEYLSNGSLKKHISDELRGLDWDTRFQIIKGICQGLHYLHKEKNIIHMDLKPSNILLDDRMVPKITGFGISGLITMSDRSLQWLGYSAPECTDVPPPHKRDNCSDIYSLGVIIRELVTGSKDKPNMFGVLRKWKHRWNKSGKHRQSWYHQVHKCLELALRCLHRERNKRPPICSIIRELNELDNNTNVSTFDQEHPLLMHMLDIEPLELHFPYEHNKAVTRSIELINGTDDYFACRITTSSSLPYLTQQSENIVPPRSKCSVTITLQALEMAPEKQCNYDASQFYVWSTRVDESLVAEDITEDMFDENPGKMVDKVGLIVVLE